MLTEIKSVSMALFGKIHSKFDPFCKEIAKEILACNSYLPFAHIRLYALRTDKNCNNRRIYHILRNADVLLYVSVLQHKFL